MKKLLIDVNSIVPYFVSGRVTGIGRTTLELVTALDKIKDMPFEISLYSQNLKGIGGRNINTSFNTHHFFAPNRSRVNRILSKINARKWISGYDIMHIPHNFEYVSNPEQCIVTLHDALFMKIQEIAFNHCKMKKEVPPFIRRCKRVITCSEHSKKDIIETMNVNPDLIDVIYWGVRHDIFFKEKDKYAVRQLIKTKFNLESPYFLSVSCNAERKRTDILVRAYIEKCKSGIPINDLVLVWNNPPYKLVGEIKEMNLENKIHFIASVSDEDLALLYQGATSLFLPSSYEGFGLPILESMACGTPVVTCRNSSLPEIGGQAAIYLDEPILPSIIKIMTLLEAGKIDLQDHSKLSIRQASSFTWKNTAMQTIQTYASALNLDL